MECQACRDLLKLIGHDVFPEHSSRIGAAQDRAHHVFRLAAEVFPKRVGEEMAYLDGSRSMRGKQVMQQDEKCRMRRADRLEPIRLAARTRQEPQLHEIGLETLAGF